MDAPQAVPPGMLCCEYMLGHVTIHPQKTCIVLQPHNKHALICLTNLNNLYPHPSVYVGVDVAAQVQLGLEQALSGCSIVQLLLPNSNAAANNDNTTMITFILGVLQKDVRN